MAVVAAGRPFLETSGYGCHGNIIFVLRDAAEGLCDGPIWGPTSSTARIDDEDDQSDIPTFVKLRPGEAELHEFTLTVCLHIGR